MSLLWRTWGSPRVRYYGWNEHVTFMVLLFALIPKSCIGEMRSLARDKG